MKANRVERLTKIGVTGHRFLCEIEKINQGIDKAFNAIEKNYGKPFVFVSSLAEGSDRLVVYQAKKHWPVVDIIVPLPLPLDEYLKDFETQKAKEDFKRLIFDAKEIISPPITQSRDVAYKIAGNKVLSLCDVLITIWDGKSAQGMAGTSEIVNSARKVGIPIAWVHAGNRKPNSKTPTSLGEEQGQLTLERF
jgi:hypothetical protein